MFGLLKRALLGFLLLTIGAFAISSSSLAASTARLPGFRSPSGNIKCLFLPPARDDSGHRVRSQLICSISHADYAGTLQDRCMGPTGAGVDWHGWSLGPFGNGQVLCSGGILYTKRPSYLTLAYGKSWRQGVFTCASRITGVTCRNRSGHGLFLSRETWRIW